MKVRAERNLQMRLNALNERRESKKLGRYDDKTDDEEGEEEEKKARDGRDESLLRAAATVDIRRHCRD